MIFHMDYTVQYSHNENHVWTDHSLLKFNMLYDNMIFIYPNYCIYI